MTMRNAGAIYLITKLNSFLRLNSDEISTSAANLPRPTARSMSIQVASAAIGISTEFYRKSKKSRNDIPKIVIDPRILKPNADSEPSTSVIKSISIVQKIRLLPV